MKISDLHTGAPATIHYASDSRAAEVTRVTAKRVYVVRVETTNERNESDHLAEGELPVRIADGVPGKWIGRSEMYTLYTDRDGEAYATRGDKSIRVRFGYSRSRVDYKS